MPASDIVLIVAGCALGLGGGVSIMRAATYLRPEFQDYAGSSRALLHWDWYTVPGQRLLRRGFLLQAAAAATWLVAAAT